MMERWYRETLGKAQVYLRLLARFHTWNATFPYLQQELPFLSFWTKMRSRNIILNDVKVRSA